MCIFDASGMWSVSFFSCWKGGHIASSEASGWGGGGGGSWYLTELGVRSVTSQSQPLCTSFDDMMVVIAGNGTPIWQALIRLLVPHAPGLWTHSLTTTSTCTVTTSAYTLNTPTCHQCCDIHRHHIHLYYVLTHIQCDGSQTLAQLHQNTWHHKLDIGTLDIRTLTSEHITLEHWLWSFWH